VLGLCWLGLTALFVYLSREGAIYADNYWFSRPLWRIAVCAFLALAFWAVVVEALREYRRQQMEFWFALGIGKLADDALLLPKLDGTAQSPRAFSKEWSDVAASIGLPEITFRALRHTHASHLIDAGIDVVKISRRLGHASPAITLRVYAHLFRKQDDKSAAAINAAVAALFPA